jgi:hypothetical protein
MKLTRILSPLLLAFTLLFIQSGGLAHGIQHTLEHRVHDQSPAQDKLCDLCAAYSQIGSALSSSPIAILPRDQIFSYYSIYSSTFRNSSFAAFAARAPPYSA